MEQMKKPYEMIYASDSAADVLLGKLDEAIADMENGRVQTLEDTWKEIDAI